jgi:hypothetical protein
MPDIRTRFALALLTLATTGALHAQPTTEEETQQEVRDETRRQIVKIAGVYQCGPERIVVDTSWVPRAGWNDGAAYRAVRRFPPGPGNQGGQYMLVFGHDEFRLHKFFDQKGGEPFRPEQAWDCTRSQ